jgi:hypothetical protein
VLDLDRSEHMAPKASASKAGADKPDEQQTIEVGGGGGDGGGGGKSPPGDKSNSDGGGSGPKWNQDMLESLSGTGLVEELTALQGGFKSVFANVGKISPHHFANRMVQVSGKTVVLGDTTGDDRTAGAIALAEEIIAGMGGEANLNKEAVKSTVHALLAEVCPETGKRQARGGDRRKDNADEASKNLEANRALAAAFATEAAGAEKRKREMQPEERDNRLKSWNAISGTPTGNDCPHLQQQKTMTDEIEAGQFPVKKTTLPLNICDEEDNHKQAGKDEDIVGAETKNVLTGRSRIERWANGVVAASANMADRAEIVAGAFGIVKAVRNATNITTMAVLTTVMNNAMAEGRKAFDGEYGPAVTLGSAFHHAAREVARQNAAIAVQVAAGRATRDPKDPKSPKKERTTFDVKLPDGTKKTFKIMAGGNPECPVDCTRKTCKKNSKCAFNHRNLA